VQSISENSCEYSIQINFTDPGSCGSLAIFGFCDLVDELYDKLEKYGRLEKKHLGFCLIKLSVTCAFQRRMTTCTV
jgi:hypothetical protein